MFKKKHKKILSWIITSALILSNFTALNSVKADVLTILNEGFNNVLNSPGTTTTSVAPEGWVFKNIGAYASTSTGYFGSSAPALKFGTNGSQVTTPSFNLTAPATMSFWLRGASTDSTSDLLVEKLQGTDWKIIETIKPLPTTATTMTYTLSQDVKQIRFTYTKVLGNADIDDFKIVQDGTTTENVSVTGVTLDKTTLDLAVGQTSSLTATVAPALSTNKNLRWASDKTTVATVVNGVITAVAEGTANITVTTEDGFKTSLCVVTVNAKAPPANKTFNIIEITDFHGQLLDSTNTKPVGAALAKVVKDVKA
ncbi:MAG: Ig domain-containing protein, partial [Clostridiaceae bacterium]|nr:Ig domain-containing protein [Clostridiaceae bacterium]